MKFVITKQDVVKYVFFLLGIIISTLGIVLITKANLGTSQISGVPYVLSLHFDWLSFGMATLILNIIFWIIQVVLLKNPFKFSLILQLPATFLFSYFIDLEMNMLSAFIPSNYIEEWLMLIAGCIILGLGISIEVAPNVVKVPGDGVVYVIAQVKKLKFGLVKIILDLSLVIIAVALSFIYFNELKGIGVGTIFSALVVGKIVMFFDQKLKRYYQAYLFNEQ